MLADTNEEEHEDGVEAVCEELRELTKAVSQARPVVNVSPTPVSIAGPVVNVPAAAPVRTLRMVGTYNGKNVDLTITCTH